MATRFGRTVLAPAAISLCIVSTAWPATASNRCATCHPKQASGFAATGMASSVGRPIGHPSGRLNHRPSASRIEITTSVEGMSHKLTRQGITATYNVDYFIGSGHKGRSYLVSIGGRLFQSPASYYTDQKQWDLSPGFQQETQLDFDRPISSECLFCHSGRARPVAFTLNTYESPPFESEGITCERCHGPADAHVAKPSKTNIVNPANLEPRLRDAVCEQCHLGGEARILNPERHVWDYQPGQPLEDVIGVYVFGSHSAAEFKVVSHSELLRASRCAEESGGRLWCGTCHDPHEKPANPEAYFGERCRRCHSAAALGNHSKPATDCVGCHMPARQAYDGGHTAFTDHQILARPRPDPPRAATVPANLVPWRPQASKLTRRNLGLAHISVGEREQSAEHWNEGFRQLSAVEADFADDTAVLTSLGAALMHKGVPVAAARYFWRASEREPRDARHRLNLAVALNEAGQRNAAVRTLETAVSLDPYLPDTYFLLSSIYGAAGNEQLRRESLQRYLQFVPQSINVRRALSPE